MNLFRDQVMIAERTVKNKGHKAPIKTDNKLFLCPKCRRTWEWERNSNGIKKLLRYDHIPRYGKKKQICRDCE